MSVKLSKKHGVNPVIQVCFWCQKDKNEVALLGKLPKDAEAPKRAVLNYEPCDECKKGMDTGITLISVQTTDNGTQPITKNKGQNLYPTGSWAVVKQEAAERIFEGHEIRKMMLVEEDLFRRLGFEKEAAN